MKKGNKYATHHYLNIIDEVNKRNRKYEKNQYQQNPSPEMKSLQSAQYTVQYSVQCTYI